MVLLRSYDSLQQASIVQGMLKNHGIESAVNSNASSMLFPAPDGGIGRSDLYVSEEDATRALQILKEYDD